LEIDKLKNRLVVVLQGYFSEKYIFKIKSQKGVFISWSSLIAYKKAFSSQEKLFLQNHSSL
jgi:hypothetical protein